MQFLKRILGVNRSATNILVRGELGRHTLQEEVLRRTIGHAKSMQEKDDSYLVKQAYCYEMSTDLTKNNYLLKIHEAAPKIHEIHQCFEPYADPYQNIYNIPVGKLKKYTKEIFHTQWKAEFAESTKGETYRLFKDKMEFEKYLDLPNRKERVSLTKFRVSDHKLGIEEGRRCTPKIPREQRTCIMCTNDIDSEHHFLMKCKLFPHTELLNKTVEKCLHFNSLDDSQKFIYLMSQDDPDLTLSLSKSIHKVFEFRAFMDEYFYKQKPDAPL